MDQQNKRPLYLKILSLFSVIRGYNVITLVIAQYLASIFVFSPEMTYMDVLLNYDLFLIVLATVCVVSAGYIINNFYDADADKINKPIKSQIDGMVSQNTKLGIYFTLNLIGVTIAWFVSWKATLFFSGYIFLIWFYSHKLKKYAFISLASASILMLLPFFVIFVYYKNFSAIILIHGIFLFLLIVIRELMKNLENLDGDLLTNHNTIPIKFGEKVTKRVTLFLTILLIAPVYFLLNNEEIGLMRIYFYVAIVGMVVFGVIVLFSSDKKQYRLLHNLIKLLIFTGVFSLILIRL